MEQNCRLCLIEDVTNSFSNFSNILLGELSIYECYKIFTAISLENQEEEANSKICLGCLQKLQSICIYRADVIKNNELIISWKKNGEFQLYFSILNICFLIVYYFPDYLPPGSNNETNIKLEFSNDRFLLEDPLDDEVDDAKIKIEVNPEDIIDQGISLIHSLTP